MQKPLRLNQPMQPFLIQGQSRDARLLYDILHDEYFMSGIRVARHRGIMQQLFYTSRIPDMLFFEFPRKGAGLHRLLATLRGSPAGQELHLIPVLEREETRYLKGLIPFGLSGYILRPFTRFNARVQLDTIFAAMNRFPAENLTLHHYQGAQCLEEAGEYKLSLLHYERVLATRADRIICLQAARVCRQMDQPERLRQLLGKAVTPDEPASPLPGDATKSPPEVS